VLHDDRDVALDRVRVGNVARQLEPAKGVRVIQSEVSCPASRQENLDRPERLAILEIESQLNVCISIVDIEETGGLVARRNVR
jgi:hypothetical protein